MRLVPLGTNGYIPTGGRQTMSYLVLTDEAAILLDAGTGVARLFEPEVRAHLVPFARLDVVLTHYHLDHVIGLSFLPGVWRGRPVRIHAPGPPLTEFGPEALDKLIEPPLFPLRLHHLPSPVEVVPYGPEGFAIGATKFAVRRQKHPGGSCGLRLDDALAYTTDTVIDPATAEFARGAKLLLHEVWLTDEESAVEDAGRTGHSAAGPVADLAFAAGVGRLFVVHHHPKRPNEDLEPIAESMRGRAGCPVEIPVEGRVYEL
ncbi:MAG: MBL fold metallo-hydrolase [Thermoanaerobaculia bacterium]